MEGSEYDEVGGECMSEEELMCRFRNPEWFTRVACGLRLSVDMRFDS